MFISCVKCPYSFVLSITIISTFVVVVVVVVTTLVKIGHKGHTTLVTE